MIALSRRYRFPAAHVLRSDAFSDAENQRIYGKCANPAGHGHDYGLEVTVAGPIDAVRQTIQSGGTTLNRWNDQFMQWFRSLFQKRPKPADNGWN